MKKDPILSRPQQVAHCIKDLIQSRQLSKGDQLPSIREMAKMFATSPDMVGAALDMLNYEGIVLTKPRYGSFVANDAFLHAIDWNTITKKSNYNPSSDLITKMFAQLEVSDCHIAMHSVSDNLYMELFRHGFEMAHNRMEKTYHMELYLSSGLYELRENLAKYMAGYGMNVDPRQIVICNHIQDAISMVADLLLRSNSCILHETPGMMGHQSYINSKGIESVGIEMDDEGAEIEQFLHLLSKRRNIFFFTTPLFSSPVGTTTSLNRMLELLKICTNAEIPIVEMDEYRSYDLNAPPTYYELSKGKNVIYIGSLSRTFPFGFPFSWIIVPFRLVKFLTDIKFQHNWNVNMYIQIMINEILKDGSYYAYLTSLRQYAADREKFTRPIIKKYLADSEITSASHPMSYWVKLPVSNEKLAKHNTSLGITPGVLYSGKDDNHLLISKFHPKYEDYENHIKILHSLIESAR